MIDYSRLLSRILIGAATALLLLPGCRSEQGRSSPPSSAAAKAADPGGTVIHPPKVEQYDGNPYWLEKSKSWPAVMTWNLDTTGEHELDSLRIRISGAVIQSYIAGSEAKNHPLVCWFELTVRPLPLRLTGWSFNIDSVVYFDPIRKKKIPALKMLSQERYTEKGVVRTRFTNNLAIESNPELTENQPLQPTLYITSVEKKTIVVHMPQTPVSFMREMPRGPAQDTTSTWGPS